MPTYLPFLDEVMLFVQAIKKILGVISSILDYATLLSQIMNRAKSVIFFGSNFPLTNATSLTSQIGIVLRSSHFNYL